MLRKTALITGATGGIGRELSREFARNGYNLVLTSTKKDKLRALADDLAGRYGVEAVAVPADLAREEAPQWLFGVVRSRGIRVDVLVNNAGFGLGGSFYSQDPERQQAMLRVNCGALTRLCRLFLPGMVERGAGTVVNMCSLGSFLPGPMNAVYCASKAYVLSLTEGLAEELRHTGVKVVGVCPGAARTGFAHRANMETTLLFNYLVMHPREVAGAAYRATLSAKTVEVVGMAAKLAVQGLRLSPRFLAARISGWTQAPWKAGGEQRKTRGKPD